MGRVSDVLLGKLVVLRPATDDDRARLSEIRASPAVRRWWDDTPEPPWPRSDDETARYAVELGDPPLVVGLVQSYEHPDERYRHAGIDIFLDESVHGRGIGRDAVSTLLNHLVTAGGHHRVVIDPAAANAAAIACYRAAGFSDVGVMRRYEYDERQQTWRDGLLMEYVVDSPPPPTTRP
jgi:aminoglycoside 6'-N-acetyltransferase